MLAGALRQYLIAQGFAAASVFESQFGNFTLGAPAQYAVAVFSDRDAEFSGGAYNARVQLRTRATDSISAEKAARTAMARLLAADGSTLFWDDPTTPPTDRSYKLEAISIVNRPTWFPTVEPGEETSANVEMLVTEV